MIRSAVVTIGAIAATLAATAVTRTQSADAGPAVAVVAPRNAPPAPAPAPVARSADDKRRIVGILDVRVDGVAPEVAATFQSNLEQQLDTGHYWLASRTRVKQMLERSTKWTDGCLVGACLHEVLTQTGAELVVIASLTGSGTSYGYVVTLLRTDTGEVVSQESDRCDVCTATEAVDAATIATIKLVTSAPDKLPDAAADRAAAMLAAEQPIEQRIAKLAHHRKRVGWTLAIAGLAAAAIGGVLYSHDHDPALAVLGVGGGAVASGVIVLSF